MAAEFAHPLIVQFLSTLKEMKDVSQVEVEGIFGMREDGEPLNSDGSISHGFGPSIGADHFHNTLRRFNPKNVNAVEYQDEFFRNHVRVRRRVENASTREGRSSILATGAGQPSGSMSDRPTSVVEIIRKVPLYRLDLRGIQTQCDLRLTMKQEIPLLRGSPDYPSETDVPLSTRSKQTWIFPFPTEAFKHFQIVFDMVRTFSGTVEYHMEVETRKSSMPIVAHMSSTEYAQQFMAACLSVAGEDAMQIRMYREIAVSEMQLIPVTDAPKEGDWTEELADLAKLIPQLTAHESKQAGKGSSKLSIGDKIQMTMDRLRQNLKSASSAGKKSKVGNAVRFSRMFYPVSRSFFTFRTLGSSAAASAAAGSSAAAASAAGGGGGGGGGAGGGGAHFA